MNALPDYSVWPCARHDFATFDDFLARRELGDGIYLIPCGASTLDVLVQGLHNTRATASGACLVSFGGALSDRRGSRPPYFSGRGVAAELKLPLVAISDPSLTLDGALPLAWYAGNSSERKFAHVIARVLDHIATCSGLRLILFGGSGGGYAALVQTSLPTSPFTALVWNPQTNIGEYVPEFVLHYLKVAFPDLAEDATAALGLPKNQQKSVVNQLLPKTGVLHTLWDLPRVSGASVLYLQNRDDWHLSAHAKPYLGQSGWRRLGANSFGHMTELALHIGNWGAGHAAPPKELINDVLRQLIKGESVTSVAAGLAVSASPKDYCQWFVADGWRVGAPLAFTGVQSDGMFRITVAKPPLPSDQCLEYAVYLFEGGVRKKVFWYQPSPEFVVPIADLPIDAIKVFVRDELHDIRTGDQLVEIEKMEVTPAPNHPGR